MLQDAIWANTGRLADSAHQDRTVTHLNAGRTGWICARDNPGTARDIVVASGSRLGSSHQLCATDESTAPIWPWPAGFGTRAWDPTVDIAPTTAIGVTQQAGGN